MNSVLHPREVGQIQAHITKTLKPNLLNSLLRELTISHTPEKALLLYNEMLHRSLPPDHFTYTYVIKACSLVHATQKGHEIHARILKSGHHSDVFIQTSLINLYASSGDPASARRVFSGISRPDVISWTSIVSALARNGCEREALLAFSSMDVRPNPMTLVCVLPACSQPNALKFGKAIHGYSLRSSCGSGCNIILDNAILDMYMNCKAPISACYLLETMPDKDVVSWTTMVSGYARNGGHEQAIAIFHTMLQAGDVVPNEATLVTVLCACASLGALSVGKWVHSYLYKSQFGVDGLVGNALINMYAKCGDIVMAFKVFGFLPYKDLVSWCTIIGGMAMNGQAKHALQLFSLMLRHGVWPDSIAFLAVLSACCHGGLVNQGLQILKAMREVYAIVPQKEHYGCMVDIYGRAGLLKEAKKFVRDMPIKPDGHVLGTLLSAYKIHGGDEVTCDRLQRQLLEGEVVAGGGLYALLSNMLATAGEWEDSHSVRAQMGAKRIRKTVGCSWVDTQI